jgi:phosphonate transport system ATP-binding protein
MKLRLDHLSGQHPSAKTGSTPTLRDLSLTINAGEQIAIIGPSGAGKTTLLHLMACALKPSGGHLYLDDTDPWKIPRSALQKLRGELFLAPQLPPLPPRQRVVTAVLAGRLPHQSFCASLRSLFYPSDIPRAEQALARFDLAEKLFERVDRLSGGERQRVGLARALVSDASLLLVDEPLSALDPSRSQTAINSLTNIAHERGATLLTSLHHVDMALANFPRILGLRNGQLAFDLPAAAVTDAHLQALYAEHLHELSASLSVTTAEPNSPSEPASPAAPVVMHCR